MTESPADAAGPADGWLAQIAAAFADDPRVVPGAGRGFGSRGTLKVGGKIFAMSVGGRLVLKLPAARVAVLVEAGDGRPFETSRGPAREWVSLDDGCHDDAVLRLAREARAFVDPGR
jgi:hypothetical protein